MKIPSSTTQKVKIIQSEQIALINATINGNFKQYKELSKAYAKLALENFDIMHLVKKPKVSVPLFSIIGFNMFKVAFLNLFRKKSPEEKLYKEKAREVNSIKKFDRNF